MRIKQVTKSDECKYYKRRKTFNDKKIFPNNVCPLLYHTLYPYFLGLFYGAKFKYNKKGDCNVGCPAVNGIDAIVKKRKNDGSLDARIGSNISFVIYAEVIRKGKCPYHHKVGDKFIFPTCMKEEYMCPAGLNNLFPLLDMKLPKCIDKTRLRCPDWSINITYDIIRQR